MSEIPDDSPSSPSMKLMLLIIPMIQTIVNADGERLAQDDLAGPTGLAMMSTVTPAATADERDGELAEELPAGTDLEDVVEEPDRAPRSRRRSAARRAPAAWTLAGMKTEAMARRSTRMTATIATVRNAAATARPPPRGIGRRLTRRASGRSTRSNARAKRRIAGVRTSASRAADANATTSAGTIAPTPGMNDIRPR